jgi:hypothetical protein
MPGSVGADFLTFLKFLMLSFILLIINLARLIWPSRFPLGDVLDHMSVFSGQRLKEKH